jgi:tellurite resistance protein TehA-like permease
VVAVIAAFIFIQFLALYGVRLFLHPKKCGKEWDCPLRSNSFGMITIAIMLFSFLIYDEIEQDSQDGNEENPQLVARIFWWIGAVGQTLLTVAKGGEWIGRRLELEHVHPHYMIFPVGLSVAALVASIVGPFDWEENSNQKGNILIARFFNSFAWVMWITLFIITFFKAITTHNSDSRIRHGYWIWLAAPCMIGLSSYTICVKEPQNNIEGKCENDFADFYFIGMFFFMILCWATLPHLAFFGRDPFGMAYWIECFALDTLAACACLFYSLNGYELSQTFQWIGLMTAAIANFVAFFHTVICIINQRGVFTPEVKWGPLSFMKLTHEAFRGNMDTMKHYLDVIDLDDDSDAGKQKINLFATHFNRFRILHEEHAKHEDEVIFKTFNDFFTDHAKKYNEDHAEDHVKIAKWCGLANSLLDVKLVLEDRKAAFKELKSDLVLFFDHFADHMLGEEDNLNPIGRKHIPMELMKQISREVWLKTSADRWEIIVPFIIENLPRHMQRVRYLQVLTWAMPERAQQIGAIVYRNVDAVMWERLRTEVPEIIPRGAPGWKRYY